MKKKKLIITDPLEEAALLGITSTLKAYKLAWLINQNTPLQLTKVANLHSEVAVHAARCPTHFLYKTEHCTSRLIANRVRVDQEGSISYLVPSLKHVDFFFSVQDFTKTFNVDAFCHFLKDTKKIMHITIIDLEAYKSKAHLFFY